MRWQQASCICFGHRPRVLLQQAFHHRLRWSSTGDTVFLHHRDVQWRAPEVVPLPRRARVCLQQGMDALLSSTARAARIRTARLSRAQNRQVQWQVAADISRSGGVLMVPQEERDDVHRCVKADRHV